MENLSLFAGIGGFDYGFEQSGIKTVAFSEIDVKNSTLLAQKWPNVPNLGNIKGINGKEFKGIDVITGGFPCQDVSIAGRRSGLAGQRSGLFWEFVRIIDEATPRWFVIENVVGLLSSGGRRDFGAVLGALAQRGYGLSYRVLNAQYFGVAQRRRRVFIVGYLGDWRCSAKILFDPEIIKRNPEARRRKGPVASALTANGVGAGGGPDDNAAQANHLIAVRFREGKSGGGKGPLFSENLSLTLATLNDQVILDPYSYGVRRLTPVECERLMGFPDNYTQGFPDSTRYRMLGNAVCVSVSKWIGKRISEAD